MGEILTKTVVGHVPLMRSRRFMGQFPTDHLVNFIADNAAGSVACSTSQMDRRLQLDRMMRPAFSSISVQISRLECIRMTTSSAVSHQWHSHGADDFCSEGTMTSTATFGTR